MASRAVVPSVAGESQEPTPPRALRADLNCYVVWSRLIICVSYLNERT